MMCGQWTHQLTWKRAVLPISMKTWWRCIIKVAHSTFVSARWTTVLTSSCLFVRTQSSGLKKRLSDIRSRLCVEGCFVCVWSVWWCDDGLWMRISVFQQTEKIKVTTNMCMEPETQSEFLWFLLVPWNIMNTWRSVAASSSVCVSQCRVGSGSTPPGVSFTSVWWCRAENDLWPPADSEAVNVLHTVTSAVTSAVTGELEPGGDLHVLFWTNSLLEVWSDTELRGRSSAVTWNWILYLCCSWCID